MFENLTQIYPIRLLREVWHLMSGADLSLISAGVAFFTILSIFPGLAALVALFGLWADPMTVLDQITVLQPIMPDAAYLILTDQLSRLLAARPETLGLASILSVLIALWSARAGVGALILGLNAIFNHPSRHGVLHILLALLLTLCLIGVALVALSAVVILPVVIAILPLDWLPEPWVSGGLFDVIRWGIALFVLFFALGILYRFGPNRTGRRLAWFTPGAVFVVVFWVAASIGFSTYLTNFGTYNEVYGSIGAVVAMLMWLYISTYLVLLGATLNVAVENLRNTNGRGGS